MGIYLMFPATTEPSLGFDNPNLKTPKTYQRDQLKTWEVPPVVQENHGYPGEWGEFIVIFYTYSP